MGNDVHFTGRLDEKTGDKVLHAWPRTLRICKRVHGRTVRLSFTNRTGDSSNDLLTLKLETTLKGKSALLQDIASTLPPSFDPDPGDQTVEIVSGQFQEFTISENGMFLAEDCRFTKLEGDTACGIHFHHSGWKGDEESEEHNDIHIEC